MLMGEPKIQRCVLGVDVGSVSISLVRIGSGGELVSEEYALHHGDIRGTLSGYQGA
jgi:hypothetical protein